jgi:hypothetical protein
MPNFHWEIFFSSFFTVISSVIQKSMIRKVHPPNQLKNKGVTGGVRGVTSVHNILLNSETDRKPINRFSIVLGLDLDFDCLGGKSSDSTHVSHVCRFFLPSVKKRKIEMIVESRPSVKVLQKVIEQMKNAPILDFHCVDRKLK